MILQYDYAQSLIKILDLIKKLIKLIFIDWLVFYVTKTLKTGRKLILPVLSFYPCTFVGTPLTSKTFYHLYSPLWLV